MTNYLIRRLVQMFLVVFVSSFIVYMLLNLAPGGPLWEFTQQGADRREALTQQDYARLEKMLGLDKPLPVRYLIWLTGDDWFDGGDRKGIIRGDWGDSWKVAQGVKVLDLFQARIGNTLILSSSAILLALLIAIPIGIFAAVKQYSKLDYALTTFSFFGIAMPTFWFGLMLILVFSLQFKTWGLPTLPPGGTESLFGPDAGSLTDRITHLIMPCTVLSLLYLASWSRYMRSSMLEVLKQDYVRTARAKGVIERLVIAKHALRNALIPIITIVVLQIPSLFGGAIITETIFAYNGMGRLFINALTRGDYPVLMIFLLITAILVVVANLIADLLYTVVDPRIRYS
ncbi:MAG: ABC transporter permease [Chloroflexi bacterium]|nr:ABC transporter permease [Chloroflexota bacterium]